MAIKHQCLEESPVACCSPSHARHKHAQSLGTRTTAQKQRSEGKSLGVHGRERKSLSPSGANATTHDEGQRRIPVASEVQEVQHLVHGFHEDPSRIYLTSGGTQKLLVTSASLLVTSALLVVTRTLLVTSASMSPDVLCPMGCSALVPCWGWSCQRRPGRRRR